MSASGIRISAKRKCQQEDGENKKRGKYFTNPKSVLLSKMAVTVKIPARTTTKNQGQATDWLYDIACPP